MKDEFDFFVESVGEQLGLMVATALTTLLAVGLILSFAI